jgi:hypothetical protein
MAYTAGTYQEQGRRPTYPASYPKATSTSGQHHQQASNSHQKGAKHDEILAEAGAHIKRGQQAAGLRLETEVEGQVEQKTKDSHRGGRQGHIAQESPAPAPKR